MLRTFTKLEGPYQLYWLLVVKTGVPIQGLDRSIPEQHPLTCRQARSQWALILRAILSCYCEPSFWEMYDVDPESIK